MYCTLSRHTVEQNLCHSQTTATTLLAVRIMLWHWSQFSAFQHYSKLMILAPGYKLLSSQLVILKFLSIQPLSVPNVLHNSCRPKQNITVAATILNKEHGKKKKKYIICTTFWWFSIQHLGEEIRTTTQHHLQWDDIGELSKVDWWHRWLY